MAAQTSKGFIGLMVPLGSVRAAAIHQPRQVSLLRGNNVWFTLPRGLCTLLPEGVVGKETRRRAKKTAVQWATLLCDNSYCSCA